MFSLPFLQKNSPESDKYIFILFLSGEKAYGFAFEENDPENRSTLYQEHVDSFLKNAAEKVEKILANVERDLGENVYLKKTVLVLNALYTTESGAIREDFLKQIKKLLKAVDLDNLGYLNFYEVINFHFGKKYPRFHLLEESVYDYNLYILADGEVEKTTKIAKSEDTEGNFKEISKLTDIKLPLSAFFYKKPQGRVLEYKHLLEEGDLAGMFTEVYFKDKTKPQPRAPQEPLSEAAMVDPPKFEKAATELPMAPGFTIASTELAFKEDFTEKPFIENPVPPTRKFSLPKIKFNFTVPKLGVGIYLLIGLGIFLLGFLGYYFFLHRAEVVLSTKKESYSSEIKFKVSDKSPFAEQFSTKVTGKSEGATTGEKVTGEKAKGEITVYNGLSEKRDLAEGAVFKAKNGAQFVIDSAITVPAATDSADIDQGVVTKAFGKKTVSVTAREIGAEGNIDNGSKLTYGDLSENDFYALANADFNGGVKKTVAIFSSRDAQNLERKALSTAKSKLRADFSGQHEGDILFPETISTSSLKKNFSEEIGAEVSRVTLSYDGTVKSYYAPYRELVAEVQEQKLRDKEFVEGTFSLAKVKLQSSKNGIYDYSALVKGKVQNLVDQVFLKSKLRGKTTSSAKTVLSGEQNIIEYTLATKPLPLPILPIKNERIILKFTR